MKSRARCKRENKARRKSERPPHRIEDEQRRNRERMRIGRAQRRG